MGGEVERVDKNEECRGDEDEGQVADATAARELGGEADGKELEKAGRAGTRRGEGQQALSPAKCLFPIIADFGFQGLAEGAESSLQGSIIGGPGEVTDEQVELDVEPDKEEWMRADPEKQLPARKEAIMLQEKIDECSSQQSSINQIWVGAEPLAITMGLDVGSGRGRRSGRNRAVDRREQRRGGGEANPLLQAVVSGAPSHLVLQQQRRDRCRNQDSPAIREEEKRLRAERQIRRKSLLITVLATVLVVASITATTVGGGRRDSVSGVPISDVTALEEDMAQS